MKTFGFATASILLTILALVACGASTEGGDDVQMKGKVNKVKDPTIPEECKDIEPECVNGIAKNCVTGGKIEETDCNAQSKVCAVDASRGAECVEKTPTPGPEKPCGGQAAYEPACVNNKVTWCEKKEDGTEQVKTNDCGTQSMTCEVNTCADGAACCGVPPDCSFLGTVGGCGGPNNNTRYYCIGPGLDELAEEECGHQGLVCIEPDDPNACDPDKAACC